MVTTAIFAFFINNSAAAAMMIPIGDAVVENVFPPSVTKGNENDDYQEEEDAEMIEMSTVVTSFKDGASKNYNSVQNSTNSSTADRGTSYGDAKRREDAKRRKDAKRRRDADEEDDDEEASLSEVEKITKNNKRCLYLCLVIMTLSPKIFGV